MNELVIKVANVEVQVGEIQFNNYEHILDQAHELATLIRTVEVDEESIKETKKLLAAVNKRVNELDGERILIKKKLLEPYLSFEEQVKTISSVVKEADSELRKKVRELEEKERQVKAAEVVELFHKRKELYPHLFFLKAEQFITPQHLNKTFSMNNVEKEMAQWFDKVSRETELIKATTGADLEHYAETLDLIASLPKEPVMPTEDTPSKPVTITIDSYHLPVVLLFLKQQTITYKFGGN